MLSRHTGFPTKKQIKMHPCHPTAENDNVERQEFKTIEVKPFEINGRVNSNVVVITFDEATIQMPERLLVGLIKDWHNKQDWLVSRHFSG